MIKPTADFRFEQAVYGNFPFWHRGYSVLACSSGCRPEWLAELQTVCQRCGEPPAGIAQAAACFALRLKCGPWLIAGVHPLGRDDCNRPGALGFHALFVSKWAYRWAGSNPFAFGVYLRRDWCAAHADQILSAGHASFSGPDQDSVSSNPNPPTGAEELPSIVMALTEGRRVVVQSSQPIDALARSVWRALPLRVRWRASLATWAYDNANQFDLVAVPKLVHVYLRSSDLVLRNGATDR